MTQAKGTAIVPDGIKFEMVEETHLISGGASRSEAALVVKVSGYSRSNTEMKDRVLELVEAAGVNRERFRLSYGANKDLGVIALYIASWETKGAMPVRVSPNALSFHIGGVFRKYPSLRPNTTVEPEVTATTEKRQNEGTPEKARESLRMCPGPGAAPQSPHFHRLAPATSRT